MIGALSRGEGYPPPREWASLGRAGAWIRLRQELAIRCVGLTKFVGVILVVGITGRARLSQGSVASGHDLVDYL